MTAAAMLMKEIETLPEESVTELLDFALFLRTKKTINMPAMPKRKSMFGAFPSINTTIEREEDRL
jgi:peroxiredoxin